MSALVHVRVLKIWGRAMGKHGGWELGSEQQSGSTWTSLRPILPATHDLCSALTPIWLPQSLGKWEIV